MINALPRLSLMLRVRKLTQPVGPKPKSLESLVVTKLGSP
jgi:hypothetical protein